MLHSTICPTPLSKFLSLNDNKTAKEDKVNNTGRYHIMKNRYGMDGLTFSVKADTSTGHFEVFDYQDSEESEQLTPSSQTNKFDTDVDTFDKQLLRKKFFELEK